ncbi:histone deacetylase 6-like isoform X1 [Eriocheir sinensis]|uniref:histone deacetylase 6-like isoform X1 n=1 Tax=Eriocheir sinensis TaxID=95602 RepID=UPI0021C91A3E|nr:histone deacetylase 6-like isoform X1 [Eriocheir sinensis]
MKALLSGLAEGHMVLALEGGFSLNTISYCMTLCAKALLGDPLPPLEPQLVPNKSAVQTINDVIRTHSRYWQALCFKKEAAEEEKKRRKRRRGYMCVCVLYGQNLN